MPRDGPLPLSPAQRRLWFLEQLDPGNPAYHIPLALRLRGPLDPAVLQEALHTIARRHEVLRSRIVTRGGRPVLVVDAQPGLDLGAPRGVEGSSPEAREEQARRMVDEEARRPFDLATQPPLRAALLRVGAEAHVLVVTFHHIVIDAASAANFVAEFVTIHHALKEGGAPRLPLLEAQYADVAAWQEARMDEAWREREVAHWRRTLEGVPALDLPVDLPRRPVRTRAAGHFGFVLGPREAARIADLAKAEGATVFTVLLAAYQALLARISGQDDFAVGSPFSSRDAPEADRLLGVFLNTVVLRSPLRGDPTFRELVGQVRAVTFDALAHGALPFETLVDALDPARDLARTPLFQVMFTFRAEPAELPATGGLTVELFPVVPPGAKFEVTLLIDHGPNGITAWLEYDAGLFHAETARRWTDMLHRILAAVAEDPDVRWSQLPWLAPSEPARLASMGGVGVEPPWPVERCLHHAFEERAATMGDHVALRSGAEAVTYADLDAAANRLAHRLQRSGVRCETPVGLLMDRSLGEVVGLLGILKAGGAFVPLDPEHPPARIAWQLVEAGVRRVVTERRFTSLLPGAIAALALDAEAGALADEPSHKPPEHALPGSLAYVMYTSGSTGAPKGVMLEHRGPANFVAWLAESHRLAPGERIARKTPLTFDVAIGEVFWALSSGATLVVVAPGGHRDPAHLAALFRREGVTTANFVPSMLRAFLQEPSVASSGLRRLCMSGEPLPADLVRRCRDVLPDVEVVNLYGPTEASIEASGWSSSEATPADLVPIGRPVTGFHLEVVDRAGDLVPQGVVGGLAIGGLAPARGYLRRPDLTAAAFVPDPLGPPGSRRYLTGDRARFLDDGRLLHLGREDAQVKVRGVRVEPGEVEAALRVHPAVRDAAVVARKDAAGDTHLFAYLVAEPGAADRDLEEQLLAHLRERLPTPFLPTAIHRMQALPTTPSGKRDLTRLPDLAAARPASGRESVPPRTPTEAALADAWRTVLGTKEVGVHDPFFRVGGDSLRSLRVVALARDRGILLTPRDFYDHPTIAMQAAASGAPLDPAPATNPAPARTAVEADPAPRHAPRTGRSDSAQTATRPLRPDQPASSSSPRAGQGSLVCMQARGAGTPWFFVHPGGGMVASYALLADAIGSEAPFYAFEAIGLWDDQPAHATVEAMADHYLGELRRVQPRGPYHIGGYSLGCAVAFEMVHRLQRDGGQVRELALIEPGAGLVDDPVDHGLLARGMARMGQAIHMAGELARLPDTDPGRAKRAEELRAVLEEVGVPGLASLNPTDVRRQLKVLRGQAEARAAYTATPLDAPVVVMLTPEGRAWLTPRQARFDALFRKAPRLVALTGDHRTLLDTQERVATIAAALRGAAGGAP